MRKILFTALFFPALIVVNAQNITQQLQKAYQQFADDSQLKHAISSFYVIDAATGQVIFDKNSQVGLAPASTQKIIIAATAFELLGKDYRYRTIVGADVPYSEVKGSKLLKRVYVEGFGDPSLGSPRFGSENKNQFLDSILYYLKKAGIDTLEQGVLTYSSSFEPNPTPGGWIWQDIGNYYGAAPFPINWQENQFDVYLDAPTGIGNKTEIKKVSPSPPEYSLLNLVRTGTKSSGDNAYIYFPVGDNPALIQGTIPEGEKNFKITGAVPDPPLMLTDIIRNFISKNGIFVEEKISQLVQSELSVSDPDNRHIDVIKNVWYTHYSPSLDSLVYWFLKKSINLYGEALIRTFALEKTKLGNTATGVKIVKDFWKQKGIDPEELNIVDGSGLSPEDRVTTHAQVEILKYARKQSWYTYFYNALPEYNNMKMKSGTIKDVKSFCGYQKAANGKEYIFSFLVNNYSGSSSLLVNKMYKVLDLLK
jgi:D-alanyl-D-alanine carboxypeptidase/D-alanyl-D-alanine-endopeptidase (penicillin-binding protein 4)